MALGFTYLSPLVGVYSLFAYSLSIGGPPSIWWIVIVGLGQLMVALVFGEVVSQYPLAGGIYPWTRRLWNRRYAWVVSWIYIWAVIVTITAVAEFGGGFVAALFGVEATPAIVLASTVALLVIAFVVNYSGTRMLSRIARIGLAAELVGVIALGLFLLLFRREQPFSIFFDSLGAGGGQAYAGVFLAAALSGLFLFYGFEACGDVAEEVADPARQIPRAMILTIVVGGVSGFLSYAGLRARRARPAGHRRRRGRRPDPVDPRQRRWAPRAPRSSWSSPSSRSCPACCRCRRPAAGCCTPSPATGCSPRAAGCRACRPGTPCPRTPCSSSASCRC